MRTYYTHNNSPKFVIVMREFGVYFHRIMQNPTRNYWVRIDKDTQEADKWRVGLELLSDDQLESMYFMEDL